MTDQPIIRSIFFGNPIEITYQDPRLQAKGIDVLTTMAFDPHDFHDQFGEFEQEVVDMLDLVIEEARSRGSDR